MPMHMTKRTPERSTHPADTDAAWKLTGMTEGSGVSHTIVITRSPFRIGRRSHVEMSIDSPVVSGLHAELLLIADTLAIRDLGSTNGTFLNGRRVVDLTPVQSGDRIEIGTFQFRVERDETGSNEEDTSPNLLMKTCHIDNSEIALMRRSFDRLLDDRALSPCFQPIHALDDGDIHGYEYLARSATPGMDTPARMFGAAESFGRSAELSQLCRVMAVEFSAALPSRLPVFMNTHPDEELLEEVVPQLAKIRESCPVRPLVLEIHESAITEPGLIRSLRSALLEINVGMAFDDFGRGQTRFRELICTPSDYVKFDSALIKDLQDISPGQIAFFRSILRGISEKGGKTIAEGVETESMADVCREVGFDLVQGYLFSRPAMFFGEPTREHDTSVLELDETSNGRLPNRQR